MLDILTQPLCSFICHLRYPVFHSHQATAWRYLVFHSYQATAWRYPVFHSHQATAVCLGSSDTQKSPHLRCLVGDSPHLRCLPGPTLSQPESLWHSLTVSCTVGLPPVFLFKILYERRDHAYSKTNITKIALGFLNSSAISAHTCPSYSNSM